MNNKKVFIKTFGCQMNVRDTEVVCGLLADEGYKIIDSPEKADILILNTCSVRQHAEDKVWSEIGRWKESTARPGQIQCRAGENRVQRTEKNKKQKSSKIIGVIGCMAQNYKEAIFQRTPDVDFVVGPQDIVKIPDILRKLSTVNCQPSTESLLERKIWETDGDIRPDEIYRSGFYADKEHAYVVISEGCSNFCSYCVVPYVRGPLRNRNSENILNEIKTALDHGISRITLIGQNVNAYQWESVDFVKLICRVNSLKGLKEFGFITSHPKDTSTELFKAMHGLEKLKKYLHLPVQSGSDRILELMNRGYTRKYYLDLAGNYRKIVKGGVLTTDIIVGFPGETKQDFGETYDLVKAAAFNAAFIFKYSPRPRTQAERLADDVPRAEKERRHGLVLGLQKSISRKDAEKKS